MSTPSQSPDVNQRRRSRHNALQRTGVGLALAGAGTGVSVAASRRLRRMVPVSAGIKQDLKVRLHPKNLGMRLGASSAQVTGLGLAAVGAKHLVHPDERVAPVSLERDVVRPMARKATFQPVNKAFVAKSMLPGGVFKPVAALSRGERKAVRAGGAYAKIKGPTMQDNAVRALTTPLVRAGAGGVPGGALGIGRTRQIRQATAKSPTVSVTRDHPIVGSWSPSGSKGGQRRNKGHVVVSPSSALNGLGQSASGSLSHELAHARRRKPMSAFVRMNKDPRVRWGDEARADHAMPKDDRLRSTYRELAHDPEAPIVPEAKDSYKRISGRLDSLQKAFVPRPPSLRTRGQLIPRPRSTRAVGVGQASRMPGLSKAWDQHDQDKLSRRRRVGRALSLTSGTMGLAALGLRAPSAAKAVLRAGEKSPVRSQYTSRATDALRRVAAHEPAATTHSNTLGIAAIGAGSLGSFNYASQQKLERRKEQALSKAQPRTKDHTAAGSAIAGVGAATAATGLAGGGFPGFKSNSSTIAHVRNGGWAQRTGAALSSSRGGVFGYRVDAHQGALNRFEADKAKYANKITTRNNMFMRGREVGKIKPEHEVIRHLKVGRKLSHGLLIGGLGVAAGGTALVRRGHDVKKDDRSLDAYHGAIAGAGVGLSGIGLAGAGVLRSQGRKWQAREGASLRTAHQVANNVLPDKSSREIYENKNGWAGKSKQRAYDAGMHRGDATQAHYFSRVYRNSGKMMSKVGLVGLGAGAVGLGGMALHHKPERRKEQSLSKAAPKWAHWKGQRLRVLGYDKPRRQWIIDNPGYEQAPHRVNDGHPHLRFAMEKPKGPWKQGDMFKGYPVAKAQSHLASHLSSRVSPQAEASYNRMHQERREMRAEAIGQGSLAGVLGASAAEGLWQSRGRARWGTAAAAAGAATTAYGAYRSGKKAQGRTRAMASIEAAGRRRARAKQYGVGRGGPVDPTSRARNLANAAPRS